jgi:hypothetical protein
MTARDLACYEAGINGMVNLLKNMGVAVAVPGPGGATVLLRVELPFKMLDEVGRELLAAAREGGAGDVQAREAEMAGGVRDWSNAVIGLADLRLKEKGRRAREAASKLAPAGPEDVRREADRVRFMDRFRKGGRPR